MWLGIDIVIHYLPQLLAGFAVTVLLVTASLAIGLVVGGIACFGRMQRRGPLYWIATAYVTVMRGIPELVVMFWIYYCGPLILDVKLSPMAVAIASMALYAGAFLAEILRGGVLALPRGQIEAARALGLDEFWVWTAVGLPQAVRMMLPAFLGLVTLVVKVSGIASAIAVPELVYEATLVSAGTFRYFEMFSAIGVFYFMIIFPVSLLAQRFERRGMLRLQSTAA